MNGTVLTIAVLCSSAFLHGQTTAPPIIKVTLLGTGTPAAFAAGYYASGRVTAGLLIEAGGERMLFDCGQGIVQRLLQSGGSEQNVKNPNPNLGPNVGVDKVFISHLHSDHMADLPALYSLGWLWRQSDPSQNGPDVIPPLRVWGPGPGANQPIGTASMMGLFRLAFSTDFVQRALLTPIYPLSLDGIEVENNVVDLWPDVVYISKDGKVKVTAFLVDHRPVEPSYGFRVDYAGKSVVFSGDTRFSSNLVNASKGADLVIHEVYAWPDFSSKEFGPDTIFNYHTTPEDAARVFNQTAPKMAVYTHIGAPPGTTPQDIIDRTRKGGYTGPLTVGSDLMVINVNATDITTVAPKNVPPVAQALPSAPESFMRLRRPTF